MSESLHACIIIPVFNDWESLQPLLHELAQLQTSNLQLRVLVIDDGSTEPIPTDFALPVNLHVSVVTLAANSGHQRAIAVGLVDTLAQEHVDFIAVIDGDGEDDPAHIVELLSACRADHGSIAVAQRKGRVASKRFVWLYALYKMLFHLSTGKRLDFGNFVVMTPESAKRLCAMPELWNHFPATIMKSKLTLIRVPLRRRARYFGSSRMNFPSLINHGLGGLSVFADTVFARLLILVSTITAVLGVVVTAGIVLRIAIGVPIPGWLALVVLFSAIGLLQLLTAVFVVGFLHLSSRSVYSPAPRAFAEGLVYSRVPLAELTSTKAHG